MASCTTETHQQLKRSHREFELSVDNYRPWPGAPIAIGECRLCHSTIACRYGDVDKLVDEADVALHVANDACAVAIELVGVESGTGLHQHSRALASIHAGSALQSIDRARHQARIAMETADKCWICDLQGADEMHLGAPAHGACAGGAS